MTHPARSRPARWVVATAALAVGPLLGACSSGSEPVRQTLPPGTTGAGSTVTTSHGSGTVDRQPTGTATVDSFEVRNQISCAGAVDVTTGVTYATTGATEVAFLVDGTQVPGTPPTSGTFDVPVACDGASHTVVLVAVDAGGGSTVDSRVVLTTTTPQGN